MLIIVLFIVALSAVMMDVVMLCVVARHIFDIFYIWCKDRQCSTKPEKELALTRSHWYPHQPHPHPQFEEKA
jgi:hypothetical protein